MLKLRVAYAVRQLWFTCVACSERCKPQKTAVRSSGIAAAPTTCNRRKRKRKLLKTVHLMGRNKNYHVLKRDSPHINNSGTLWKIQHNGLTRISSLFLSPPAFNLYFSESVHSRPSRWMSCGERLTRYKSCLFKETSAARVFQLNAELKSGVGGVQAISQITA